MNPDQLPAVSTFRVDKPGKSKFTPSIGGRKPTNLPVISPVVSLPSDSEQAQVHLETDRPSIIRTDNIITTTKEEDFDYNSNVPLVTTGKKIESIQSRRMAASSSISQSNSVITETSEVIKLPAGPKDAASIATSTSVNIAEKRTMAYFLKDSGEGREMAKTSNSNESSDPSLNPSKTRRIVNLRNIKAPPRSSATSTALAPQVRVIDGAIVYDEKFTAALTIQSNNDSDLDQELEYFDEDDENRKHLTSATYSTKAKCSNRWNPLETNLFYEALAMCGTDFSMIQTLFPHRTRAQIKGKYKLEEKSNSDRINSALKSRKTFDTSFKDRVKEAIENNKK